MIILTESNFWLRPWMAGCNFGPITFIRKSTDNPLVRAHEAEHERWFWRNPLFYGFMCWLSKEYHLASEVAAYKVEIAMGRNSLSCAQSIARNYGFDVSVDEVLELLK